MKRRDWPSSVVTVLALVLILSLFAESVLIYRASEPSFVKFTGRQSAGTVSLVVESDLPALTVVKSDVSDPANTNASLNYTITITSSGSTTAYNVTLNETYPSEVTFINSSPAPLAGNTSFLLGDLIAGSVYVVNITVNITSTTPNATIIDNNVNVSFASLLNLIRSVTAHQNTTINNGSEPEIIISPGDTGGGGGGGGGGCSDLCVYNTSICTPDGRKTCVRPGIPCTAYLPAPCAIGTICSKGDCVACTESWMCDDWDTCSASGIETRTCFDVVGCGTEKLKPAEERACIPGITELPAFVAMFPKIGIPPVGIPPELFKQIPLPVVAGVSIGLLIALVIMFAFRKRLEKLTLYLRIAHAQGLLRAKQYALAHVYIDKIIRPFIHDIRLDPRGKFDRKLFRMYYGVHRDLARQYEHLAHEIGDTEKANHWKKQADHYAQEAMKYG